MPEDRREPEFNLKGDRRRGGRLFSPSALAVARLLRLRPLHGPRRTGQQVHDQLEVPRWALTVAFLLFVLLFLSLLVLFFLPVDARADSDGINFDEPTKDWHKGPVRYIITKQEVKAFKSLDTELDRINFINWFWERRDIIPSTVENEFRDRYEQRVYEATRLFSFTVKPGWKTDMGKIFILVGPPDDITADMVGKSHRGIVTWLYRDPPFEDLRRNTVIGFARDVGGDFVLSTSPTLDSDVARGLQFNRNKITTDGRLWAPGRDPALLDMGMPVSQGELETMMIFGKVQQLPPKEEELFRDLIVSREFYGRIPMDSRVDFYKSSDASTYTTLTVGIKSSSVQYRTRGRRDIPDVHVFGKLIDKNDASVEYPLGSDGGFVPSLNNPNAGPGDLLIYQATVAAPPGIYEVVLGVEDRVAQNISAYRKDIEVPDLSGEAFSISSVTLATDMEPVDFAALVRGPFYLGRFRVIPQPDNAFRSSNELNIYFQVYNPTKDPETYRARLDILYTFRSRDAEGNYQDLGMYQIQDSHAQVQGYAVPLEKWPKGEFQVVINVLDRVSGQTVTKDAFFFIKP